MKISWIKKEGDNNNFNFAEKIGMNIVNLKNPEVIDDEIKKLINQAYDTFIISNEIAGFSEDIIKKYNNNGNINIIISRRK